MIYPNAKLHNLILLLQRKMRIVRLSLRSPINVSAAIILPHLLIDQSLYAQEIALKFGLQKSKVSRILKKLEEQRYIETSLSEHDSRKKELIFTPRGKDLLKELCILDDIIAKEGLAPLTKNEQDKLAILLCKFADQFKEPRLKQSLWQHPIVEQQDRLTRACLLYTSPSPRD